MMKILLISFALILLINTKVNAASLKNLSEQLSSTKGDNTKEKMPNEDSDVVIAIDETVNELDKLKNHASDANVNELDGLKNHREKALNLIHLSQEYINNKALANSQNPSEAPSTSKDKEILENLPLSDDASEVTIVSSTKKPTTTRGDLKTILRHHNGKVSNKFSAYDMAQYIFFTGDEEGVAKAVEELIDEGLMSRENAIEFLNDIRVGIDYLENIYSLKESDSKMNTPPLSFVLPSVRTTTQSPIEDLPFSYNYNYQKFHSLFKASNKDKIQHEDDEAPTLSPTALKNIEKIPALLKLIESHRSTHHAKEEALDDESGRTRIAEYISGEYSLEEVIYQLAKTMFDQSLKHASPESQTALQKLTEFIESEGKHGRISPALQKRILDVLLAALSDTLSENPEIMEKARHAMNVKK